MIVAKILDGQMSPIQEPNSAITSSRKQTAVRPIDVNLILSNLARANPEELKWQTSIVDLMKLLGLDSSIAQRRQLARELRFIGSMNNSRVMNIWLLKQVMAKLA